MRVCNVHGCSTIIDAGTRCATHTRQAERKRGTRQQRGYDNEHVKLRARWATRVATGTVKCWRCSEPLDADEPWQLGHDDDDRSRYRGPEHQFCNLSAAGKAAHK